MYFAGIGSRDTPQDELYLLRDASRYFCEKGYTLRSGGADGADRWCEKGCDQVNGEKEIYLPWRNFNDHESELYLDRLPSIRAMEYVKDFHPAWHKLNHGGQKLHTRNVFQVFGRNLDVNEAVKFVLCFCRLEDGIPQGGTATAIRIAEFLNIPVINIFLENHKQSICRKIYKNNI